ncbi:MAG TPA: SDR family oxidoreductase, partial [Pseudonocardiaceae bacterium]|nr:SDR family oxidoreductase [Pseudonocardiaceae bacterium]
DVDAVLAAGRKALRAKALVVLAHDGALGGFLRTLHREHPDIGITLVRVPPGCADAARWHAEPGRWRELVLGTDGVVREPVERPLPEPTDEPPVTADDVVLVSGGGRGIGHACARALGLRSGAALAIIGRADPATDEELRDNLAGLRADGLRVAYRSADVIRHDDVRAAIAALTADLGPVTGVLHASGVNEPARFDQVDAALIRRHVATKVDGLRALLAALEGDRLRLLVTFGSVIGRVGLPGESHYALANGALRAEAERLAGELPNCRVRHIDWSVWSGTGMGERLGVLRTLESVGITPIPVAEGTESFLRLLAGPEVAVSVHGRLGTTPPDQTGGFLRRIRVYEPGVEVVADVELTAADPYLADHRLDGIPVLPGVVGLEALAQAASLVAGRALTVAENVAFDRPVTGTTIQVCALRRGDVVETVLRRADVDHFRAEFPLSSKDDSDAPALVDGGDPIPADQLYGPLFFHTGRFRRVATVSPSGSRACRATLTEDAGDPWFVPVLGPPTLLDGTVHALQCCVPHRRLLPVGCERVEFRYRGGPLELHARERCAVGGEYTWDAVAVDTAGRPAIRWAGLRLRDAGPLPRDEPWPVALLAVFLERCAHGVGLDPALRVAVAEPFAVAVPAGHGAAWEVVGGQGDRTDAWLIDALARPCAEPVDTRAARASAMTRCLGRPAVDWRFVGAYDGGWVLFGSGDMLVASVVVAVVGMPAPVAVALCTSEPGT